MYFELSGKVRRKIHRQDVRGGLFSVSQDKKARLPVSQKHGYMHEADAGRADFIAAASSQLSASDFLQTQLFSHGRFMRENARFPSSRTSDRYHWCGNPHPFEPSEEYHDNEQSLEGSHPGMLPSS